MLALALFSLQAAPVMAELPDEILREIGVPLVSGVNRTETVGIQSDLAWIGLYNDRIDGRMNSSTQLAIGTFLGALPSRSGYQLSAQDRNVLRDRARQTEISAEFRNTVFDWTGTSVKLPTGFLRVPQIWGSDLTHISIGGRGASGLSIEIQRYDVSSGTSPASWLSTIVKVATGDDETEKDVAIETRGTSGSFAYVTTLQDETVSHQIFEIRNNQVRGIQIRFEKDARYLLQPILSEILMSLDLFAGPAIAKSDIGGRLASGDYPGGRFQPEWYRQMVGSGSGSVVSYDGHILTNHHVVSGCDLISVNGQDAILLGSDIRSDLALVQSEAFRGRVPVKFRNDPAILGEQIYVMGYPVFDVSPSVNVTDGIVSSTVGLMGDRTNIQITAPVQPGNSGGPVLDQHGAQLAVVVSKASAQIQLSRNIENIAWVIRSREAIDFMKRFEIRPIETSRSDDLLIPIEARVANWRQQTVRIECLGQ